MLTKIAIIISHPIQHFCPQYRSYANNPDWQCKIFFASSLGKNTYEDKNFKSSIKWDNLYLDHFEHEFLNNEANIPVDKNIDAPELEHKLDLFNPDILIINGYFQKFQRRAYNWGIKNKKRLFYISDSEDHQKRSFIKKHIKTLFLKKYFKKINTFLSVGDANESYYKFYGCKTRQLIRNFFPIDIFSYEKAYQNKNLLNENFRKTNNVATNTIVCTVVGKLVGFKNQEHLIQALIGLNINEKINLLIVGSGPDEKKLNLLAEKVKKHEITFTGFVKPTDLPEIYAATDIYIHPAYIEPHSLAISEAIYMGCPVIISSTCGSYGPTDDVQPGRNGFVYNFGNISELQALIKYLATNPNIINTMSQESHNIGKINQEKAHGKGLKYALTINSL